MASSSVPAAAVAVAAAAASAASRTSSSSSSSSTTQLCAGVHGRISFPPPLMSKSLSPKSSSQAPRLEGRRASVVTKAKLNEIVGGVSIDAAALVANLSKDVEPEKEPPLVTPEMTPEAISEFMNQVASLVKLVDSKDIVELQLKQPGCELTIRKKEALPQPPSPPPAMMMPSHVPPSVPSPYPALPPAAVPAAQVASPAPASSSPPAAKLQPSKSSHPPLKSPMAGTFYRSPAPGQPPFVKPGDKVKKGQVLCIIEAMKLMNEIEADHPGTVVEILAEDGKPVGVEQPLLVIEP